MDVLESQLDGSGQEGLKDDDLPVNSQDDTGEDGSPSPATGLVATGSDASLAMDPTHYFRADANHGESAQQVTYRVVQVSQQGEPSEQLMTTGSLPPGTQVAQAVLNSPFSSTPGAGPAGDGASAEAIEPRFYTIPATGAAASVTAAGVETAEPTVIGNTAGGQFYVMMSPQDVLASSQRNLAPRPHAQFVKADTGRTNRDDRRRATHNEVERRRRDKINTWIMSLSKLIPGCTQEPNKQGQPSKGGILSKACDYITELRETQASLATSLKDTTDQREVLRTDNEALKQEVLLLRAQLQQHGIPVHDIAPSS